LRRILDRYILREVVANWLVVTGVLLVILLTNQLARVLERAAENQYPQAVVLELIGLGALQNLSVIMPIGLLLGVVLAFGRLYHDSEMAAALACGVGPSVLYRPIALLTLAVTLGIAWLTLDVAPGAIARSLSLRGEAVQAGQFAPIAPGRFRTFGSGDASSMPRTSMRTARSRTCSSSAIATAGSKSRLRSARAIPCHPMV
jgi:lipopolysaccharide export system permease protein